MLHICVCHFRNFDFQNFLDVVHFNLGVEDWEVVFGVELIVLACFLLSDDKDFISRFGRIYQVVQDY